MRTLPQNSFSRILSFPCGIVLWEHIGALKYPMGDSFYMVSLQAVASFRPNPTDVLWSPPQTEENICSDMVLDCLQRGNQILHAPFHRLRVMSALVP